MSHQKPMLHEDYTPIQKCLAQDMESPACAFTRLVTASVIRDGLVVGMSASHVLGRGFTPQLGHTKDHRP